MPNIAVADAVKMLPGQTETHQGLYPHMDKHHRQSPSDISARAELLHGPVTTLSLSRKHTVLRVAFRHFWKFGCECGTVTLRCPFTELATGRRVRSFAEVQGKNRTQIFVWQTGAAAEQPLRRLWMGCSQ